MSVVHRRLSGSLVLVALCLCAAPAARAQDAAAAEARHIETLVARGLHPLAIKEARRFLERHAKHAEADAVRFRLAGALVEAGQADEARELYAALATRSSFASRGEAALRLARLEWTAGQLDAAATASVLALESGPAALRADAAQLLGEVEYRRGRHAEADAAWRRAEQECEHLQAPAERQRVRRAALSGRAWCAFHAQNWDEVIARIDELVAEQPEAELDELWLLAGDAHARAGRHDQARAAFGRVRAAERQELA
ncbi:MAG: tetratricopeptide repeat protein, partial [Planctomycetes bacterium]|nr:tetratricopeptide repeat protein [Planctomycetota bacterium]